MQILQKNPRTTPLPRAHRLRDKSMRFTRPPPPSFMPPQRFPGIRDNRIEQQLGRNLGELEDRDQEEFWTHDRWELNRQLDVNI